MLLLYVTVIAQVSVAHALGTYGVHALVTTVSGACKKKKIQALNRPAAALYVAANHDNIVL